MFQNLMSQQLTYTFGSFDFQPSETKRARNPKTFPKPHSFGCFSRVVPQSVSSLDDGETRGVLLTTLAGLHLTHKAFVGE